MFEFENKDKVKELIGIGSINIFGRPFSGKDTQGRRLAEILGGNLIGGGEILRQVELPEMIKNCIEEGILIPSCDYVRIVEPFLEHERFRGKPLILSSVGRWSGEEEGVIESVERAGHPLMAVIHLFISTDESRKRWKNRDVNHDREGRKDDDGKVLETRFKEYDTKTLPVLEYYRSKGLLFEVDGTGDRDKITQDILNHLVQKLGGS